MPTKQQKAAAEPFLEQAADKLRDAKKHADGPYPKRLLREEAARSITKANQLLKGK